MSTIFWDFDGTLAYSHHLWSGSMYRALTAVCPYTAVPFSAIRECNTRLFTWQTPERDYTAFKGDAWWHRFEAQAYTAYCSCGIEDTHAAAAASLVKRCILSPENYHLYPDTVKVLNVCRQRGHRNVLLSNNYPELSEILQTLGLLPLFDGVIVSALEGYDKPRQELFHIAATRYPDTRYYMIGDNPRADVLGGKQAGMTTVLVHTSPSALADYHAETLSDILPIIK